MSIIDELIENLVERNTIKLNGAFTITLVNGGLSVRGQVLSTLHDRKKTKDILNLKAPVAAEVRIGDIVIPVPQIK
jgi:hypothetical protein